MALLPGADALPPFMRPLSLIRHAVFATSRYRIHSPFVYQLAEEVLADKGRYYAFEEIERQRAAFLADRTEIVRTDYGTGRKGRRESVAHIARHAAVPRAQGERLFRLVQFLRAERILELGTSLGIGTRYLAGPGCHRQLISLEGDPELVARATRHLGGDARIELRSGAFEATLEQALSDLGSPDLVWLDGNHSREATLRYFHTCLGFAGPRTCLVFDDIHWSAGMESAWETLRKHPSVTLSMDLYRCGLVFFRPENRQKEHFLLYP
jgi:predicted O-methyltransferase YrrM